MPLALLMAGCIPSLSAAQTQWWSPNDRSTWAGLSRTHAVNPPGFLDDHKTVPFTFLTGSPAVAKAMQAGGFAYPSKPSNTKLLEALSIIEAAQAKGQESLVLSTMRIQILAVLDRDPELELNQLGKEHCKKPSPYLAFEIALAERWCKFRAKVRTPLNDSYLPLERWSSWQPESVKEKHLLTLVSFSTGVRIGRATFSPLEAASALGQPEVMEWVGRKYSAWQYSFPLGQKSVTITASTPKERVYSAAPFPFRAPSSVELFRNLSQCSDRFPRRHLAAYLAYLFASDAGRKTDALRYAKRFVANAPDSSPRKREVADYVRRNGG